MFENLSDSELLKEYNETCKIADQMYVQVGYDYSIIDTQLVELLEEETGLLALAMTFAYRGGVNYSDAFGTVGIWESIIYRRLLQSNIVSAIKGSPGERSSGLVGGFVKDVAAGMYKWVVSLDLNSLYPHLFLQYNMSPETHMSNERENVSIQMVLDGLYQNEENNYSVCANGVKFNNKNIGILPSIIEEYYAERKEIKQQMLAVERDIEAIKNELSLRN